MQRKTKNSVLVRPNLKLFVLAAVGFLVVQQLISSSPADPAFESISSPPREAELQKRIDRALEQPTVDNYLILSESYRLRGENERAIHFLRKARLADEMDL